MNTLLKELSDATSDCCVTVILKTHRTFPDHANDIILLKNMVKEAEGRLQRECSREVSAALSDRLSRLASSVDHRYNQESLILFVNEHIADYIKLPVSVENRVVIGTSFSTRDLLRASHKEKDYLLLVLSRSKARLIEAFNDTVVQEIEGAFPIENTSHYPRQRAEAAIASRRTNLIQEFFNFVDKRLIEVINRNPLRVVICTEESNYHQYLKVADRKEIIMGHLPGYRMEEKANNIVTDAWPIVQDVRRQHNKKRLEDLAAAESSGKLVTDVNEIWRAVNEGRGETLFVQQGYFLPAVLAAETVELVSEEQAGHPDVVDDLIDKMIRINSQYGGDSVFLSPKDLEKYQGLVLTTRY